MLLTFLAAESPMDAWLSIIADILGHQGKRHGGKKKKSVQRPPSRDDASSAFASSPGASDLVFPLQLPCLCQLRSRQAFMPRQATKAATTHPKSRQSHDPDGRLSPPSASLLNPPRLAAHAQSLQNSIAGIDRSPPASLPYIPLSTSCLLDIHIRSHSDPSPLTSSST